MKRLDSSNSLGDLMSVCPSSTEQHNQESNPIYPREYQTVLDGLDEEVCAEQSGHVSEKKRRLTVEQVKALEKNFEVENKLEPERKVKLAQEIGLQPRQVAVWFQNRRARYKTKQLERDYGILKGNFDSLKHNYDALQHDNELLLKEIREMKSELSGDAQTERKHCLKKKAMTCDSEEKSKLESDQDATELDFHHPTDFNEESAVEFKSSMCLDFKDGSSDSTDSSAIMNEENDSPLLLLEVHNGSTVSMNQFQDSMTSASVKFQAQYVKIEEHNFFGEESCSTLFSDDQAPALHWYIPDQWN